MIRKQTGHNSDINETKSSKKGLAAHLENIVRKFTTLAFIIFLLPIIIIYVLCIGLSLAPGIYLFELVSQALSVGDYALWLKAVSYGLVAALGFILFILTLIFVVPLFNLPIKPFVKPYRGAWYSLESMPWYYHNALTYLVRYTILEFLTPSPLNILFFKMMGMKIGKNVIINSSNISDPCLIQLDDYVTIGGSAYMMAHYGMKGFLVIDKLHLKRGAMIGLGAKLLGGVTVGEKATVLPNSAVLPKTVIADGDKFGVESSSLKKSEG
ncbi:MAG: acyltransferase [Pseudobdellovibrio sp.]